MWNAHPYFHSSASWETRAALDALDPNLDPHVLIVGALHEGEEGLYPLSLFPENGDIHLDALRRLTSHIKRATSEDVETGKGGLGI